jgi:hypothetical protein
MDKKQLLKFRGKTVEVPIEGGSVTVRPLSRAEVFEFHGQEFEPAEAERKLLAVALVDPKLTEEEVGEWQKVADSAEINAVLEAVSELSGVTAKAAAKSSVAGTEDE